MQITPRRRHLARLLVVALTRCGVALVLVVTGIAGATLLALNAQPIGALIVVFATTALFYGAAHDASTAVETVRATRGLDLRGSDPDVDALALSVGMLRHPSAQSRPRHLAVVRDERDPGGYVGRHAVDSPTHVAAAIRPVTGDAS